MKKIIPILTILAFFAFAAPTAKAQITIFNLTPCPVQVVGAYSYLPNPCTSFSCTTPTYTVPANGSFVVPGGNCLSFSSPPPTANFIAFKLLVSPGNSTGVELCSNPVSSIRDCFGTPRTVQIFNYNFGAIY